MDRGEEISGGFVITRGGGSELLELAEEILHEMARFVHLFVEGSLDFAAALGRDHRSFSCGKKRFDHTLIGITSSIGSCPLALLRGVLSSCAAKTSR